MTEEKKYCAAKNTLEWPKIKNLENTHIQNGYSVLYKHFFNTKKYKKLWYVSTYTLFLLEFWGLFPTFSCRKKVSRVVYISQYHRRVEENKIKTYIFFQPIKKPIFSCVLKLQLSIVHKKYSTKNITMKKKYSAYFWQRSKKNNCFLSQKLSWSWYKKFARTTFSFYTSAIFSSFFFRECTI